MFLTLWRAVHMLPVGSRSESKGHSFVACKWYNLKKSYKEIWDKKPTMRRRLATIRAHAPQHICKMWVTYRLLLPVVQTSTASCLTFVTSSMNHDPCSDVSRQISLQNAWEIPCLNLGPEIGYLNWGPSWLSLVPPGKWPADAYKSYVCQSDSHKSYVHPI
jgi:hypothetical protein